ncbi:MAG: hypothetical protein QF444_04205 [Phycisphaerales bacterium]|jgi:hypothetical protein|nr:hypothetical protein [Phycisphaerales bacterium]
MKRLLIGTTLLISGCQTPLPDISKATQRYPFELHSSEVLPIQVIRKGEHIIIVNSTADDFNNATIWINQQYTQSLPMMPAGSTIRINLWDCYDAFGEKFNAGGFWRTDEPTKLVLAELQQHENQPLIGLLVIGEE